MASKRDAQPYIAVALSGLSGFVAVTLAQALRLAPRGTLSIVKLARPDTWLPRLADALAGHGFLFINIPPPPAKRGVFSFGQSPNVTGNAQVRF